MWTRNGNKWYLKTLPALTVEPCTAKAKYESMIPPTPSITVWRACFAGHPVPHIPPGRNSRDVMQRAYDYFDRRVDL